MSRIATVDELKSYLGTQTTGDPGSVLANMLDGAETFAERYCGRRFTPDPALASGGADTNPPVSRTIPVREGQSMIRVPDLRVLVSATLDGAPLTADDYDLGLYNTSSPQTHIELTEGVATLITWPRLTVPLVLTGRFGFNPPPADVKDAILTLAARSYRERDASFADTVQGAEGGLLTYFRDLPGRVKVVLDSYRIPRGGLIQVATP